LVGLQPITNLHSAIDDDIYSGHLPTVIGGREQSDVRHFLLAGRDDCKGDFVDSLSI
jgi:hypothetical protein